MAQRPLTIHAVVGGVPRGADFCAFRSNQPETIRKAIDLVTSELGDSGGMWAPYQAALGYLESNRDPAVLEPQNPEMREAIELLVGVSASRPLRAVV